MSWSSGACGGDDEYDRSCPNERDPRENIGDSVKLVECIIDRDENDDYEEGDDVALLFLDQEKGFDCINYYHMWECLKTFQLPRGFIHLIKALYGDSITVPWGQWSQEKGYSNARRGATSVTPYHLSFW